MEISLRPKALKEAKLEQILNGVGYPYHNEATRSEIGNGVLELFIRNWKSESYTFDLHKSDKPRPIGGFQLEATENVMIVTFVLNNNYPFGMDGLLDNLADMFLQPEDLGLSHFIIGKDAVTRVMKSKKKNGPEKWSTSFNTFGCRVNSMLHEHDTAVLKYKFLPIKPLNNDEQVIVTINKENINFRGVAQSNLIEYGEAMAVPIRIWLCTKWMAENSGGADNNLFGKMSTTDIGKTARRTDFQKLGSSLETPEGQRQHPEGVAAQVASAERLSDIDARVEKSGESLMAELMFGDAGNTALQDKADTPGVAVRGDSLLGVQTESLPIALTEQRLATVSNLTVIVPQLPLTLHAFKATKKSSYETARTHISPPTSSFNSPLSPFRSPPPGRDEGEEGGVSEEPDEMVLSCDEPVLTSPSMEVENELRLPVSGMDGLCFSDPEDYTKYRKVVVAVDFPHQESADAVRLRLFEGLQESTVSSISVPSALSLDPIDDGYQADKEQSAKTVVQAHGQSTVCSESIPRSMTIKTFQKVEQYVFYRLGHMSGTDSPSGNGGSRHSLLMESPTEVGFTTAEKEGNSITLEACRPWNLAEVSYLCAFEGCQVICSLMDGVSGICPKCGPFSTVRYCCKEHLWNDAVVHWQHCGKLAFPYQCQAGPLPERFLIGPPLVPSFHGWDSPERHRQALWFSTANEHGDYFVFMDTYRPPKWDSGTPVSRGPLCSAQVELVVRLDNPKWKARFRRLLAISLFGGVEYRGLVATFFRSIRGWMILNKFWNRRMENRLVDQIEREMGFFLPLSRICKHNVRENEWTGGDLKPHDKSTHRNCVPLHERLQENLEEDRGIGGLCDDLESVCWILRAWRLDLSMIRSVEARVRGEGFEGVPAGDRRVWHRGPGWDGFGSAPAEW